ncbi:MAG: hypothetical protein HN509_13805 [Halobacteriovoraceae bacterium]|jgi:hypothetical protein|nr:hypothetical protein [Halobacteriovoraceae bacterium]MBT5093296.1 hypothetical protein [Halobacteriovoraceae bacterium]
MKCLILLGLVMAFSPALQAREYYQKKINCRFYATEQDVYNKEKELPFDLKAEYIFGLDSDTHEVLAVRGVSRPRINATSNFSQEELDKIINKLGFDNTIGKIALDSDEIKKLITYFGDYRALVNEHQLPAVEGQLEVGRQKVKLQSHQAPETDYGVSYHIVISCWEKGRGERRTQPPQSRPAPPQQRPANCVPHGPSCERLILVTGWYPCPVWYNASRQCFGPHYQKVYVNPLTRDRY